VLATEGENRLIWRWNNPTLAELGWGTRLYNSGDQLGSLRELRQLNLVAPVAYEHGAYRAPIRVIHDVRAAAD
jgi:hypothetical protein